MRGTKSAKPLSRSQEASSRNTPVIRTSVGRAAARSSGVIAPSVAKEPSRSAAEAFVGPADRLAEPLKSGATAAATPQPTSPHQIGRPAFIAKAIDIGKASSATFSPATVSARKVGPSMPRRTPVKGKKRGRGRAASWRPKAPRAEKKLSRPLVTRLLLRVTAGPSTDFVAQSKASGFSCAMSDCWSSPKQA